MEKGFTDLYDKNLFPNIQISNAQPNVNETDSLHNFIDNYFESPVDLVNNDDLWTLFEENLLNFEETVEEKLTFNLTRDENIDIILDYNKTINDWDENLELFPDMKIDNNITENITEPDTKSPYLNSPEETNVELISNMKIKIKGAGIADYKSNCLKNNNSESPQEDFNTKKKIRSGNKNIITEGKKSKKIIHAETISTKEKKKKKYSKGKTVNQVKQEEEPEVCVDIVTVPEEIPVLEAGDVKSLLEQFEASEILSMNALCHDKVSMQSNQSVRAQPITIQPSMKQTVSVLPTNTNLPVHSENTNSPVHSENTNSPVHSENTNSPVYSKNTNSPVHFGNTNLSVHFGNTNLSVHSGNTDSPVHSGNKISPVHSGNKKSPVYFGKKNSPVHSGNKNSPVHFGNKNSPAHFGNKNSPVYSGNANSPVHSRNANSPVYPRKQNSPPSNLIKDINDPASKEVINRIRALKKETKKGISVIPAMPNIRKGGRSNGTRMQDTTAALSKNKLIKVAKKTNKTIDGGSIQLDHDYCSNSNSAVNGSDNSTNEKKASDNNDKTPSADNKSKILNRPFAVKSKTTTVTQKSLAESEKDSVNKNFIKDNDFKSAEQSNKSEKILSCNSNDFNRVGKQVNKQIKECPNDTQSQEQNIKSSPTNLLQKNLPKPPIVEVKIKSALVAKILRSKNNGLNNPKSLQDNKQMVSVLKKPSTVQSIITNNNESIVTTTNSSNNVVQNIIIQNTQEIPKKVETKTPPRRKLNLAEYRNRRENTADATKLPVQPLALVYVYKASTTTEPFKDNLGNLLWCERECVTDMKPKANLNEVKPKPPTREMETQTYETVFNVPKKSLMDLDETNEIPIKSMVDVDEKNKVSIKSSMNVDEENEVPTKSLVDVKGNEKEKSKKRTLDREEELLKKKRRLDSSSSRSRSRSYSRSKSRSKSKSPNRKRNRRDRSRSKSRSSRNNVQRQRINRPSSVSSNISCTSQSPSDIRYSVSRSASRSRSNSISDQCSPCSRSSPNSNDGNKEWLHERGSIKRNFLEHRRNGDRYKAIFTKNSRNNKDWRRSPPDSYQRSYNRYSEERSNEYRQNVIYAGWLEDGATTASLYQRFKRFGPIARITIHLREHAPWDYYGFITFEYKDHAFEALEHANDDPTLPKYDLNFGHRRDFCGIPYEDLDHFHEDEENQQQEKRIKKSNEEETFDSLLKEAKAKLGKRKV